jgi:hypothetical protein
MFEYPQEMWKNGPPAHDPRKPNDRPRRPLTPMTNPADSENNGE